jgi:hypothetical protein
MNTLLGNAIGVSKSLGSASRSGSANGTAVDLSNIEGEILVVLDSAAMSTADTLDVTIEESADNSTFAAAPADALINPETGLAATFTQVTDGAASFQVLALKKERLKRYVRAVGTLAGGSIAAIFSVHFVYSKKYSSNF